MKSRANLISVSYLKAKGIILSEQLIPDPRGNYNKSLESKIRKSLGKTRNPFHGLIRLFVYLIRQSC